ncbi:MAG: hypothetical protein AAF249_07310 [Pseudomonadota bacterium]
MTKALVIIDVQNGMFMVGDPCEGDRVVEALCGVKKGGGRARRPMKLLN